MTQVKIRRKLSTLLALVTMMTVLVLPTGPAHALTIPVDCDMGDSLQAAIDLSLAGDVITLSGTCTENILIDGAHTLLTINGDGMGSTIIDGGSADTVIDVTPGRAVTITNLTIQNGAAFALSPSGVDFGGGIRSGANLTLNDVEIIDNTAETNGGGIWNGGTLTVDGGFINDNSALFDGGGLYSNSSGTATFDGAAEIGGVAAGNTAGRFGGGIYNNGTLTLKNDTHLFDNAAADSGGGIFNTSGTLTLSFASVNGNSAVVGGGGIYSVAGSVLNMTGSSVAFNTAGSAAGVLNADPTTTASIVDSFITSNDATSVIGNGGGGIENATGATMTIDNTDVVSNTSANNGGGGIHNSDSTLTISDSRLLTNSGTGVIAFGGAIRTSGSLTVDTGTLIQGNSALTGGGVYVAGAGSTFDLTDSRIDNNSTTGGGGGIHIDPTNVVTLTRSSVTRNVATTDGGGISNVGGDLTLTNSTVSTNSAANGAGINNPAVAGTVTSTYSTITANAAIGAGGGFNNGGTITLEGTILFGNTAGPTLGDDCSGPLTTSGYNLIGVGVPPCVYTPDGTDLPPLSDPLLGGLTIGSSEYHPLGVGSDAIDTGGACALVDDQISTLRPIGPACDIGSIEGVSPVVGDDVLLVEPNGRWHIRKPGNPDYTFFYGIPGDVPLFGDWDNDGFDTPGMYRPSSGFVYLTNTLPPDGGAGVGENFFFYGNPGDQVFVGDWDGINGDSLGISRNGKMFLRNTNDTGPADVEFWFGLNTDLAFGANADGVGDDSVMVWRPTNSFLYYRNTLDTGVADDEFFFGIAGDLFVVGDWNADGIDTAGVFRSSDTTVYLKNTNVTGPADVSYVWGSPGWTPVAGVHGVS